MFRIIPAAVLSLFVVTQSHASLIINAWETDSGHVRFEYDGTLDLTGLAAPNVVNTVDRHLNRGSSGGLFVNSFSSTLGGSNYRSAFSTAPAAWKTGPHAASSFGGNSLSLDSLNLIVHTADISDDVWSGSGFMQFDSTTLAGMGVDLSVDRNWTIDNTAADTITLRNFNPSTASAVPEPSGLLLLGLCVAGLALQRYRCRKPSAAGR